MTDFIELAQEKFLAQGWRFTAGARNLARALAETPRPLSAAELTEFLAKAERPVDNATVHRLLNRFLEVEVLHRVEGRFFRCSDPDNTADSHHFLICEHCGGAEEIFLDYMPSISKQLNKEKGFLLKDVEMTFQGVCRHCLEAHPLRFRD